MRYNIAGPQVDGDVTHQRIELYRTTRRACECPAKTYQEGECKHMLAVKHGCGCPQTLWMVEPSQGRLRVCVEDRCEYGAILRQALENEGWIEIPDGILPRELCFICEAELLPGAASADLPALRYCHKGHHWMLPGCSRCAGFAAVSDLNGNLVCDVCAGHELLSVAI